MKELTNLFIKRLSLVFKHVTNKNNVDKIIQIHDGWHITLLDKKQLFRNEEIFPNFGYTAKGV